MGLIISDQVCSECGAFQATHREIPTGYCANIPGHPWVPRTMTAAERAEVFGIEDTYTTEKETCMLRQKFESRDWGTVSVVPSRYADGNPAIYIRDDQDPTPICTLSVNIPDVADQLGPDEFLAKTWSENACLAEDALNSGLFEDTRGRVPTGYVEAQVWRVVGGWESLGPRV